MTIPAERTQAVRNARNLLRDLLDPRKTPRVPRIIRRQAYWCLRHFPSDLDIELAGEGRKDIFTKIEKEFDLTWGFLRGKK